MPSSLSLTSPSGNEMFREQLEDDVWTTFVAFSKPNIAVAATNEEYLREVLARINGKRGARALPETLPEWEYVNSQAAFPARSGNSACRWRVVRLIGSAGAQPDCREGEGWPAKCACQRNRLGRPRVVLDAARIGLCARSGTVYTNDCLQSFPCS